MALPHGAVAWSAVCDRGMSRSYSLFVILLLLHSSCYVSDSVLCLFLIVLSLQCVIVVFPDHTHLLFIVQTHSASIVTLNHNSITAVNK